MKGKDGLYCRYIKRLIDIICALSAMIVFCWLYAIIIVLVRINLGSPIIFKQPRPGKKEKIFTLYKFRTMTDKRDSNGDLLPDEVRLTKLGRLLRKTSLDELPESINILKGDLSVIGPRPLATQYLPYYSDEEKHRHDVRPGLSGLAQIHGRNTVIWEDRFAYDLQYINNISFLTDCRLVLKTIKVAFKRSGITVRKADGSMDFDMYRKAQLEEVLKNEYIRQESSSPSN